ncbi:MAG TPA: 1-acyl-sn-glycerol-3-phosphate acyltransferase [Cytophagales bacterium]|jgi:1-acyl-sn-glycerol-3-phosphate acyltransferase|nr:1-acyl-sn-glycerol-3-phosphate acyltransferase [Cytophagales bacterium]
MMRTLHTAWSSFMFGLFFLLLFPFLLVPILFPSQFRLTGIFNRWWAKCFFTFSLVPYEIEVRGSLDRNKKYIFCANHFSYFDIPAFGLNPINTVFVGKNSMEKIPLFGFMYGRLHITVDRKSLRSRGNTLLASMKAIDEGKNLAVFPEGGMITEHPPRMAKFKDGAFRVAVEKQILIVPVTIPFNWKVLPDAEPLRLQRGKVKIIFHEPIDTKGLTLEDVPKVREQVFSVIDAELKKANS